MRIDLNKAFKLYTYQELGINEEEYYRYKKIIDTKPKKETKEALITQLSLFN